VLYPGVGLLEFCKVSVGRGTEAPFQFFGAPWIDSRKLTDALGSANLPGLRVSPARFTPTASVFKGEVCEGVQLTVTKRSELPAVAVGMHLAAAVVAQAPASFDLSPLQRLLVHEPSLKALQKGAGAVEVMQAWQSDLLKFTNRSQPFQLYPESGS
jgi:uncharacterized protein YbbC (DUF1343 family)